ncbi:MAG TPA: Rrf2 family transcriptional regulator [Pirellulales bacterium]|jgi:Rrf2 family protein|nr:Rrf2 family transcriptional regulator [Pirellulales bacterium]
MRLSRTVAYALQATLQLAQLDSKGPVPCSQLAAAGNMPERFLLQVLRNLVTHGVLQSSRGVEGGYFLGRDPASISLLEIIEAIDGPLVSAMPLRDGLPGTCQARLEETLSRVAAATREQLAAASVSDLLAEPSPLSALSRGPQLVS